MPILNREWATPGCLDRTAIHNDVGWSAPAVRNRRNDHGGGSFLAATIRRSVLRYVGRKVTDMPGSTALDAGLPCKGREGVLPSDAGVTHRWEAEEVESSEPLV